MMSPEKTEILFRNFSDLYAGRHDSLMVNLMSFGFECSNGWFDILYRLSKDLSEIQPDCRAFQVKEKFGGLRFYTGPMTHEADERIREACREAQRTCEICGKEGEMQYRGTWMRTLCLPCGKKEGYDPGSTIGKEKE